jgi:hypothetical protein
LLLKRGAWPSFRWIRFRNYCGIDGALSEQEARRVRSEDEDEADDEAEDEARMKPKPKRRKSPPALAGGDFLLDLPKAL